MRVVILGGGESGYGSAVLAKVQGHDVFVSDNGTIAPRYTAILDRHDIAYEQGGHTPDLIYNADLVIKSPGIPSTVPLIRELRARGIEIISEIEFAGRYTSGKTICITGSNGKTTTTTLIYEILRRAGYDVAVGGNIGESFAYTVATQDREWYVLEISSFQLDDTYTFRPDIAVIMNITPDHLDRYDYDFGKYADSKLKLIKNQQHNDFFVYWADDATLKSEVSNHQLQMKLLPFYYKYPHINHDSAFLYRNGSIKVSIGNSSITFDTKKMRIKGRHNIYNAMAAASAAMAADVENDIIINTIYNFEGVEHRMEHVAEKNGIEYINDSKATNVDSTWYALECMTRPTVWIAGGTDKGNDYAPLVPFAREKVKAIVCLGVDNAKIKRSFVNIVPKIYDTHSLSEAMDVIGKVASEGDTVLLSPACASFDLFKNYEDRGRQFKEAVKEIK